MLAATDPVPGSFRLSGCCGGSAGDESANDELPTCKCLTGLSWFTAAKAPGQGLWTRPLNDRPQGRSTAITALHAIIGLAMVMPLPKHVCRDICGWMHRGHRVRAALSSWRRAIPSWEEHLIPSEPVRRTAHPEEIAHAGSRACQIQRRRRGVGRARARHGAGRIALYCAYTAASCSGQCLLLRRLVASNRKVQPLWPNASRTGNRFASDR